MSTKDNSKKYISNQFTYSHLKGKFKLPTFQRRLVWSDSQKEEFISTLNQGFPFGSILTYKYPGKDDISLIDGLQRISTIQDYEHFPEKYIDLDEEVLFLIDLMVDKSTQTNEKLINQLKNAIKEIFKNLLRNNSAPPFYLEDQIKNNEKIKGYFDSRYTREIGELQYEIIEKKKTFLDTDNIEIPLIEFLGGISELAKVFENLNKGGKKLTKYQVFAAQWSDDIIFLNDKKYNKMLLEVIIKRYMDMNDNREIKIMDFSADEMREQKSINLAELCYGVGKIILDASPVFYSSKNYEQMEDLADEIGYSTLGIVFGVDNKKLHTLKQQVDTVLNADLIDILIEKIIKVYSNINSHFERYLKLPSQNTKYENKKISNFKFLSYFADLWSNNFVITKDGQVTDNTSGQDKSYSKSLNNFIYYYIQDAVLNNWGNAGDSRLNSYYLDKSRTYAIRPQKEVWEESLIIWWRDRNSVSSLLFDDISKLILTVYYNMTANNGIEDGRNYDYEHIVVKAKVKDKYSRLNIPAGSLGNAMFMDSNLNRGKKHLNLYKLTNSGESIRKEYKSAALYPNENVITQIEATLDNDKAEATIEFIQNRGKSLIQKLVKQMY